MAKRKSGAQQPRQAAEQPVVQEGVQVGTVEGAAQASDAVVLTEGTQGTAEGDNVVKSESGDESELVMTHVLIDLKLDGDDSEQIEGTIFAIGDDVPVIREGAEVIVKAEAVVVGDVISLPAEGEFPAVTGTVTQVQECVPPQELLDAVEGEVLTVSEGPADEQAQLLSKDGADGVVTIDTAAGSEVLATVEGVAERGNTEFIQTVDELPFVEEGNDVTAPRADAELRAQAAITLPADKAEAWSREQLLTYFETGVQPTKTVRGNWPYDARRSHTVEKWSASELHDWMEDFVLTPEGLEEDVVWAEVYRRWSIPGNWSYEAAEAFVLTGAKPEQTDNGVLINDRQRDSKGLDQWTHLELRSALLQEIPCEHSQEDLLTQLRKRLNLSENVSAERLLESLTETPTEATVNMTLLKAKLAEYKEFMTRNPAALTEKTAGAAQGMLYKTIRQVMARDYVEFHEGWTILLDFINENYSTLFTAERARRGWSQIAISPNARTTFEDLLTLMIHTRSPRNRANEAKLYNIDLVLRYVPSEKERQNLHTFYAPQQ